MATEKEQAKKELMDYILEYLFLDEQKAGRPDFSREDDWMDFRNCWLQMNWGEYNEARRIAEHLDCVLVEKIDTFMRIK